MKYLCILATAISFSVGAAEAVKADAPAAASAPAAIVAPIKLAPTDPLPASVTELIVIDQKSGNPDGPAIAKGNAILVNYTGWIYDASKPDGKGAEFDSSIKSPVPFGFIVGVGRVIKGWDLGVPGMKAEGRRTLIVPPALAYGEAGSAKVPPNATLIFDIDVVQLIGGRAVIR
jgi:FKBP-type peptidyl-prolyl cis-trans isomerase FkpA